MELDWITVAAQIVNFLVLVWLLHRFLYGPVVRAMDAREARIAERLREARQAREEAEAESGRYRQMQEKLEKEREDRLAEAREQAEKVRKSLQAEAREEVAVKRAEWSRNLADEQEAFLADLQERAAEAFSAMARRALSDLADARLEDQIARRFLKALAELDRSDLDRIRAECERAGRPAAVRSAFDLSPARRKQVKSALERSLGADVDIVFERSSRLVCGIELRVGGQMVRWSLDSFLDELEGELRAAVERRTPATEPRAAE